MDIACPRQELRQKLSRICTDVGAAAGLPSIDITKWFGGDVVECCSEENARHYNRRFGLSAENAQNNSISQERMYLYTNPCLLDRDELFAYMMNAVELRGAMNVDPPMPCDRSTDGHPFSLILDHQIKYRMHQQLNLEQEAKRHKLRLQQNRGLLTQLLMPHKLSTRFVVEMHCYISRLLSLLVVEESLYKSRESIVTQSPLVLHSTEALLGLPYLNEQCVEVGTCAKSIQAEALNAFLPPHYACWDKEYPLSHNMQALLNCYARNDVNKRDDDLWHQKIRQAYTMEDYSSLFRVEDILIAMVGHGANMIPSPAEVDHSVENDVAYLRFIMCLFFVIYVCNKSGRFKRPLSFTRLDNTSNIVFHAPSAMHLFNVAPGSMFCHGGYVYFRPPEEPLSAVLIRSKCVLSLFLKLSVD